MDQQTLRDLVKVANRIKKTLDNNKSAREVLLLDIEILVEGFLILAESALEQKEEVEDVTSH